MKLDRPFHFWYMPTFLPLFSAFSCKEFGESFTMNAILLISPQITLFPEIGGPSFQERLLPNREWILTPLHSLVTHFREFQVRAGAKQTSCAFGGSGECGIIYSPPRPLARLPHPLAHLPQALCSLATLPCASLRKHLLSPSRSRPAPGAAPPPSLFSPDAQVPGPLRQALLGQYNPSQLAAISSAVDCSQPLTLIQVSRKRGKLVKGGCLCFASKQAALTTSHWFAGHALG